MAISKLGSRGIVDCSVVAADFAPGTITNAKLAGSIGNDKLANTTITIGGEAISLGGSDDALNLQDWQTKITSDGSTVTTMVAGRGYFVDNSSAAGIVKLPASASIGDTIAIKDYAGNFGTNALDIQRNGHNIQGNAANSQLSTNRASVVLVYVDSTKGWLFTDEHNVANLQSPVYLTATGGTITTSGNDKIHTFTGSSNFVVSALANGIGTGSTNKVQYLVVAGGGGGGCDNSGGGGAGGFRHDFPGCGLTLSSATTYPITVGGGGAGKGPPANNYGANGSNSVFSTITSAGGGGGGSDANGSYGAGQNGGSGGGGAKGGSTKTGGSGNTPPVSPPQGNDGGAGAPYPPSSGDGGGGGGGAATAGTPGPDASNAGGAGGNGTANSITASSVTYAGGGGGGSPCGPGAGGPGGGGTGGGPSTPQASTAGTANTGGGGGGATGSGAAGSNGGSGIVVLRYRYQEG